jgi:DNA polymerase-3 subunit delta'
MDDNGVIKSNADWESYQKYIETKIKTPYKNYTFDKVTAIRIEQIRALQNDIMMSRFEGRKKVYIFENFDSLTTQGANAFLKTLEEPPDDAHFILTVNNLNKLLPTILSRCLTVEFYPISEDKIESFLLNNKNADPQDARLYSRLANGSIEKALCLLNDNNIENMNVTFDFLQIVLNHDELAFFDWMETNFAKSSKNTDLFKNFIQYLQLWLNDLQLYSLNKNKIVFINQLDLLSQYVNKSPQFLEFIPSLFKELDDFQLKFSGNINPKLILTQIYSTFAKGF